MTEIPADKAEAPKPKLVLDNLRNTELQWLDDETLLYLKSAGGEAAQVNATLSNAEQSKAWEPIDAEGAELWAISSHDDSEYRVGELPVE